MPREFSPHFYFSLTEAHPSWNAHLSCKPCFGYLLQGHHVMPSFNADESCGQALQGGRP